MCSSLRLRTEAKKTGILAELALFYCERSSVFCLLALVKLDRDKGIDRWNGTSLPFLDWVDELSWLRVHILYTTRCLPSRCAGEVLPRQLERADEREHRVFCAWCKSSVRLRCTLVLWCSTLCVKGATTEEQGLSGAGKNVVSLTPKQGHAFHQFELRQIDSFMLYCIPCSWLLQCVWCCFFAFFPLFY